MKTLIFITLILLTSLANLSHAQAHDEEWFEKFLRHLTIAKFAEINVERPVSNFDPVEMWEPSCDVIVKDAHEVMPICDSKKALKNIELQSVASN